MNSEILYSIQQLYNVKGFSVESALKRYDSRAALFTALWELSVLSHRLLSEFPPDCPPLEMKRATEILDGIHSRLDNLAAPSLAGKTGGLMTALIDADAPAARRAWLDLRVALEDFNDRVAAARRYRETIRRDRFEQFAETVAGPADEQAMLSRLHELTNSFYTKEVDAVLERIEHLLSQHQVAAAREESMKLLERLGRPAAAEAGDAAPAGEGKPDSAARKTVLVIDDIPVILLTMKALLAPRYNVIAVKDYQMATKALGNSQVDLIVVDINMPGMDGITLVKVIRAMDDYADTPIIFLTGNSDRESVLASLAAGGNDFVLKPINRDVLMQKIEKLLPSGQ